MPTPPPLWIDTHDAPAAVRAAGSICAKSMLYSSPTGNPANTLLKVRITQAESALYTPNSLKIAARM